MIPYLGVMLRDLVAIEEGGSFSLTVLFDSERGEWSNPESSAAAGVSAPNAVVKRLINYPKIRQLSRLMAETLGSCPMGGYSELIPDPELQERSGARFSRAHFFISISLSLSLSLSLSVCVCVLCVCVCYLSACVPPTCYAMLWCGGFLTTFFCTPMDADCWRAWFRPWMSSSSWSFRTKCNHVAPPNTDRQTDRTVSLENWKIGEKSKKRNSEFLFFRPNFHQKNR